MITPSFSEREYQMLIALIDAGVKAAGLQAVMSAAAILQKLDDAAKAAREAQSDNVVALPEKETA